MAAVGGMPSGEDTETQEPDNENAVPVQEPELMEEDMADTASGLPGVQEENPGTDKRIQYTVVAAAVILLAGGTVFCLYHKRRNRTGQEKKQDK